MSEGFERIGSRRVATLAFLDVERAYYRTPDGGSMVRDLVRHPGSVVVVPWSGEAVFLIRQYRAAAGGSLLELPAGKLDVPGETPEQTAIRETVEEIGMRPGRLTRLHEVFLSPGFTDESSRIFLAEDLEPVDIDPQGAEEQHAEVVSMTLDAVRGAIDAGTIRDATTLIGLYALLQQHRP